MATTAVRVSRWLGFTSELLLAESLVELPHERVFDQLAATFGVEGMAYNWSDADRGPGMITQPVGVLEPLAHLIDAWQLEELVQRHPLACWYLTSGDIRPTTSARVPTSVVSAQRREPVMSGLRQIGLEQQLSICFRLGPQSYDTYVLGRHGSDFSDDDLMVATLVQRVLIGLDRHLAVVGELRRRGRPPVSDLGLTLQERVILARLAAGDSTRLIAHRLQCSPRTVHKHLEHAYRKLGVRDRLNAARVARDRGLV
ncbi:MAG TPA: LuxR C-terminal-related transcriptional regulator [Microlunatus sp.]